MGNLLRRHQSGLWRRDNAHAYTQAQALSKPILQNRATMLTEQIPGLIIRSQSGFFAVQTENSLLTCHLRGRLKQGKHVGDIAAVGDRVLVTRQADGLGSIEFVVRAQPCLGAA